MMESNMKIEKISLENSIILVCENNTGLREQEEIMNSD